MSILVDTNILLRRAQPDHEHHSLAVESVALLLEPREPVYFTPQNISEFWNVATRPQAQNGLGFSVGFTAAEVGKIEQALLGCADFGLPPSGLLVKLQQGRMYNSRIESNQNVPHEFCHR